MHPGRKCEFRLPGIQRNERELVTQDVQVRYSTALFSSLFMGK